MISRPDGLNLRHSLRAALGNADQILIDNAAERQERTIDAILARLYSDAPEQRREMVLLADEVGLGKTYIALGVAWSVLNQRRNERLARGPVLVVTPYSHALFKKWRRETERFLQFVVPRDRGFEVQSVETPHELARALCRRRPTLVIARLPALSGRLHRVDTARMAVLHSLFHMAVFDLSLEERLALLDDWQHANRESLDLRRSTSVWEEARSTKEVGFDDVHVRNAWQRMKILDPDLCDRIRDSWTRVRNGQEKRSLFWEDIRELSRAAIGQTIRQSLPLVIVDEIHNWKNHPQSWLRFLHMLGLRIDRFLGLSATPFQLGPHELIQVLKLRRCISLSGERRAFLATRVVELEKDLQVAGYAGETLRNSWNDVSTGDLPDLEEAWENARVGKTTESMPPRLKRAIEAAQGVYEAHARLMNHLRPFLLRHRRDISHRAWWVGRESHPGTKEPSARGSALIWRPGLDVTGDAELVHYLMMRAVQEKKGGRGSTSLGADLGGSYAFFRQGELSRLLPGHTPEAQRYLRLVEQAIQGDKREHPKVAVTAERAFEAWKLGEKTLVFCINLATTFEVQIGIQRRLEQWQRATLTRAFRCRTGELDRRLQNFQNRLYNYRQSLFLLFQDHPLAGSSGKLPAVLALSQTDLDQIAARLAAAGAPRDRSRFDRRRVLSVTEQVLVNRWRSEQNGKAWMDDLAQEWQISKDPWSTVLAPSWIDTRRRLVEGVSREHEAEPLPDDGNFVLSIGAKTSEAVLAWGELLRGRAGQAVLAPYLASAAQSVPSLLTTFHASTLARMPARLRALAARMLRRLVRSPGFLARFLLEDSVERPDLEADDDQADVGWAALIHRRYQTPPASGESAKDRFEAYLDTLKNAIGLEEQILAYEEASRNRDIVARVIGPFPSSERDRFFTGFNTPLVPEVLIVTAVGQEGIDLHRECRHVVHHDLPWNPATLEQRTGRIDRIGSKAERLRIIGNGNNDNVGLLNVVVPYIAGTYDEHRFRVVHGRAHLFEVTMGGEYAVDGFRSVDDAMEAKSLDDDEGKAGTAWCPLPEAMAKDLQLRLEAEDGADPENSPA